MSSEDTLKAVKELYERWGAMRPEEIDQYALWERLGSILGPGSDPGTDVPEDLTWGTLVAGRIQYEGVFQRVGNFVHHVGTGHEEEPRIPVSSVTAWDPLMVYGGELPTEDQAREQIAQALKEQAMSMFDQWGPNDRRGAAFWDIAQALRETDFGRVDVE